METVIDNRGLTPKKLGGDWSDAGYRVISAKNIKNRSLVQEDKIRTIDDSLYSRWMGEDVHKGDIILTSEAPCGETLFWDSDEKIVLGQRLFGIRVKKGYDPYYLFLYLNTRGFQNELSSRMTGTTVQGIRQSELMKCRLTLPSYEINDYLEQLCQTYYDNFMTYSDNWDEVTLDNFGDIVGGATPSKSQSEYYTNEGIPWITPKDLSDNTFKFVSRGSVDITQSGYDSCSVKIIPKGTILYSSRAPIGYIAITKNEVTTNQGFKSIVPKKPSYLAYLYYYLKSNSELIEGLASGSTFLEISGSSMKSVPIPQPDDDLLDQFSKYCTQIFGYQELLEHEIKTLGEVRDLLLSQIMNKDAD